MRTPKAVKTVVVIDHDKKTRIIAFEADEEVLEVIRQEEMGTVRRDHEKGCLVLTVSERFLFNKVLGWLREQAA
jgi:hypothetical protein